MSSQADKPMPSYCRAENESSYADGTREHLFITSGGEATDREYIRVLSARPYEWTDEEIQAAQDANRSMPFRII